MGWRIFITNRDVLYDALVALEPPGVLSATFYRGTGTKDVVVVEAVAGFNWAKADPYILETIPRVRLDLTWADVPQAKKIQLRNKIRKYFSDLDETKFQTWEDVLVAIMNKIGVDIPKLRKHARTRAFLDGFE